MRRTFHIHNGVQLENVRTYKYLGFLLIPSGEINSGLHDFKINRLDRKMMSKPNETRNLQLTKEQKIYCAIKGTHVRKYLTL